MQPSLIGEAVARDRLAEVVSLSHEAELRRSLASPRGARASLGAALVRAGLKLSPAAAAALRSRPA